MAQLLWIESFNGRFRDEFLDGRHFDNLLEARVLIEDCGSTTRQPTPLRPRRAHPRRLRGQVDHPPTPSRIATGPLIESHSTSARCG